jgi:hypothetical protein
MEVHHHASHHGPKKWKEHITEFLMLFLAVSLGFLAENIREERVVAHQTESVMAQLYHELQKDTASLCRIDLTHNKQDTATIVLENYILNTDLEANKVNFFYLHNYLCTREGIFGTSCIALDQLKFAGVLKNVKDNKLRDCIEKYDLMLLQIKERTQREEDFMNRYMDDIRIAPFDYYYRTVKASSDSFNNVKGTSMNSAFITYRNIQWQLVLNKTFVPTNLVLKSFEKHTYLNRMLQLNGIRMSTNKNQTVEILKAGTELLQNIERVYPNINEAH